MLSNGGANLIPWSFFLATILFMPPTPPSIEPRTRLSIIVLIDDPLIEETHSTIFKYLSSSGHNLTIKLLDNICCDIYSFQHFILFVPTTNKFNGNLSNTNVTNFADEEGNIFIPLSPNASPYMRKLAAQFRVKMDEHDKRSIKLKLRHKSLIMPVIAEMGQKDVVHIIYEGSSFDIIYEASAFAKEVADLNYILHMISMVYWRLQPS